jgi:alkanesulfonate monooxygenase SsuD/methylene tetrahydromethanopterin reductase-like flavin-dependent oxidoreductase (luciferase family)
MLGITARYASEWNTWGNPDQVAGHRAALMAACEAAGRDPATMRTSVNALVGLGRSTPPPGRAAIFGSAAEITDQLGRYRGLGIDEFIVPDWNLGADSSQRADNLARIKAEVLDPLQP